MVERALIYRLQFVEDEGNSKVLASFAKEQEKQAKKLKGVTDKALSDSKRAAESQERDDRKRSEKSFGAKVRMLDRIAKEEKRKRTEREKEEKAHLAKLVAQSDKAMGQIATGRAQVVEGLTAATSEAAKFGRGLALLGIAGEESTKKMLEGLVKIQATFDIVTGGVNLYVKLAQAVKGYQLAVQGAAAAEVALGLARAGSAGTGVAGGAVGTGGQVVGSVVSGATGAAASAGISGAVGAGGAGAAAVGGTAGAGTAFSAGGGAGAVAPGAVGTAGTLGLLGLAIASTGAALITITETIRGTETRVGSLTNTIAELEVGFVKFGLSFLSDQAAAAATGGVGTSFAGLVQTERALQRQQQQSQALLGRQARERAITALEAQGREQVAGLGNRSQFLTGVLSSPQNRLADVQGRFRAAEASRQRGARAFGQGATETGAGIFARATETQARLASERLGIEREILATKRAANSESLSSANQELSLTKQKIAAERTRLLSAKERFGQLGVSQQRQLIGIKRKADRLGFGSLTRDERARLRGVGTTGAVDIARRGDVQAADRAGFDVAFGGQERERIAELGQQQRRVEVTVEHRRQIDVNLRREDDRISKNVAAFIVNKLVERDAILAESIQRDVDRKIQQISELNNQEAANRRASLPR